MRYHPAHAATGGRTWSVLRSPRPLQIALSLLAAATIGLVPAMFVATPAQAAPGEVSIDADLQQDEGGAFSFTVRRERGATSPLTLNYATVDGGFAGMAATAGVDYTPISGNVSLAATPRSDLTKTYTVYGTPDQRDEYDESFTLQFTDPANNDAVVAYAYGTLEDDDATPSYRLSTSDPVAEAAGTAQITATLDGSAVTGRDIVIPFHTQDGTARAAEDYTAVPSGSITVPANSSTGSSTVPITNDAFDDAASESFRVIGGTGNNGQLNTGGDLMVQIADDDPTPTVSVGSASNVTEGSPLSFPVTLSAPSNLPVTVLATTSNVTAASGADYDSVSQTITFNPGVTSQSVIVTTHDDALNELNPETVRMTLSVPTNAGNGTMTATGGINDDTDLPPGLTLDPTAAIAEGTSGTVEHTFNVRLDGDSGRTVRVGYAVNPSSATSADFAPVDQGDSGILTFAPGERLKTFRVNIAGDTIHEGDETFNAVLTDLDTALAAGGGLRSTPITITDDDAVPALQAITPVSQAEGNDPGTVTLRASISNPNSQAITLDVTAHDNTADSTNGAAGTNDYDLSAATATINAGDTFVDIPVIVNGDIVYETNEDASISVDSTAVTGGPKTGTFTLTNDDSLPAVALSTRSGAEGTSLAVEATVTGVAQHAIPVTLAAVGAINGVSSPAQPEDFDASGLNVTEIPAGDQTAHPVPLGTIALANDTIDEPDQTIKVTLGGIAGPVSAFQTINDDADDLPPAVSVGATTVDENVGTLNVPVTVAFDNAGNRATSTEQPVIVHYRTDDGTARSPGDFTGVADDTIIVAPGSAGGDIPITIVDDSAFEAAEAFQVTLTSVSPAGATIGQAAGAVTIRTNDSGFSVGDVSVSEGVSGMAEFTVQLASPNDADVDFVVSVSDGSAEHGGDSALGTDDFDAPPATLTIPHGELSGTVFVPIDNDGVYEGDETATLTVGLDPDEHDIAGAPIASTLTIRDNDAVPSIVLNTDSGVEGGADLAVVATVTGVAQAPMSFDVTFAGDSSGGHDPAESGDYTPTALTGTIPAVTASGSHIPLTTIALNPDPVDEDAEVIAVTVADRAHHVHSESTTYTITDDPNDLPPAISIGDVTVVEDVGEASVPVSLSFGGPTTGTERDTVVNYRTVDGTTVGGSATAGSDYTGTTTGAITIPAGVTTGAIRVPILDDSIYEHTESFTVTATSHTPAEAVVSRGTATVTVTDNGVVARPSFSVADVSVGEGAAGNTAQFTVTLSSVPTEDVTFAVALANGSAVDGGDRARGADDFDAPPASLTITAGHDTGVISVPVNIDDVYEADEEATLVVALANGEDDATGGPDESTLTIVNDDAVPSIALNAGTAAENGSAVVTATVTGVAQNAIPITLAATGASDGTSNAAEDGDFDATALNATVIPGGDQTGNPVPLGSIAFNTDRIDEPNETVRVSLTSSVVTGGTAYATITDDPNDRAPSAYVDDLGVGEGDTAHVQVRLVFDPAQDARSSERTFQVGYATQDGTALASADYTAPTAGATLTFGPTVTTQQVNVPIAADGVFERAERFTVNLTSITPDTGVDPAAIGDGAATVTIAESDTEAKSSFSVADVSVREDVAGGTANFTVELSQANTEDVDFAVSVRNGTAVEGGSNAGADDFDLPPTTLTIPAGETRRGVSIPVTNDEVYEATETATVVVALAGGEDDATGGPDESTLTIVNDDAVPSIALNTDTRAEGADVNVVATVTGVAQANTTFTLTFAGDSTGGANPAEDGDYADSGVAGVIAGGTPSGSQVTLRTFRLSADHVDEPDETVKVTAVDAAGNVTTRSTTYTITDDPNDLPPTVAVGDATAEEADGVAHVPVDLTFDASTNDARATENDVVVRYGTQDGSARAGFDYTAVPSTTHTFTPPDTHFVVDVPVADDGLYERAEAFAVNLTLVSAGAATLADGTGTVTIAQSNGDQRSSFLVGDVSVREDVAGGTANFTVELSQANTEDVDFAVSVRNGTAVEGGSNAGADDFDLPPTTLTIPAGETRRGVSIPVTNDEVYEATETATVVVALAGGEDDATGGPDESTLTIVNDDAVPSIALNTDTRAEGADVNVVATVTGVAQANTTFTLTFAGDSTGGANPAEDGDYADSGVAGVIAGGTPSGSQVTLRTFRLSADHIDEPDETVKVTAVDAAGNVTTRSTTYTITDDPNDLPPTVAVGDATAEEADGVAHVPVDLTFDASTNDARATENDVVVRYGTQDGSARAGFDYTAVPSTTHTFTPPDTHFVVDVPVADDGLYERAETFTVGLTLVSAGAATLADGTGTVTIAQSNGDQRSSFLVGDVSVREDVAGGTANFTVELSQANTEDVDFAVSVRNGTAVEGGSNAGADDFDLPPTTLTIPAGETRRGVSIPVTNDEVYEATETATVVVALAGGEDDATGGPDESTLTIVNDDAVPSIALNTDTRAEGADVNVVATVTGVAQANTTFTLTFAGDSTGGANPAEDGDYADSGVAGVIAGGTPSGSQVTLRTFRLSADHIDEPDETVKVTAVDAAGNVTTRSTTYTITDDPNDLPPTVAVGDATAEEADGVAHVPVDLTFDASTNDARATENDVVVRYGTQDGSARAGFDYTAVPSTTHTFTPPDTHFVVDVPVADDGLYERAETFTVGLTLVSAGAATLADGTGTVTIAQSNGDQRSSFLVGDVSVREDVAGGTANFTVELSQANTEDVDFAVSVRNGTAVEGGSNAGADDFDLPPTTLTIPAGETRRGVSIPVTNDEVYEATETATVVVALAGGEDDATGGPDESTLTIVNDDAVPSIALNTDTRAEGADVDVVATVTGQAQAALTFDLALAGDSGSGNDPAESGDYTANRTRGTIAAGAASGSQTTLATIRLNNDTVDEPVESVRVTATDIDAVVGAASATYGITDDINDLPPSISIGDATVAENVNNASVPVSLAFGAGNGATETERDTVVTYTTADGTATAGADYTGTTSGTLTIRGGSTTGTILVPVTDDSTYERDETFTVRTTAHTPQEAVVSRSTGTVTISRNDTNAQSTFSVGNVAQAENGGPATFTIALNRPTTQPVAFTASVAPGTAVTGGNGVGSNDYTFTAPSSLVIPAGSTEVTVPVTVNGDTVYEADETATLTVALAADEDNATGGPVSATLTIRNDDGPPRITLNNGDSGTEGTDIAVVATSDTAVQSAVTLDLAFSGDTSSGNTAAVSADYVDSGAQATIPAGTAAGVPVTLRTFRLSNDHIDEPVEAVRVVARASDPAIDSAAGVYRINDDPNDLPPAVSVGDITVDEGVQNAAVPVTLSFSNGTNDATSTTRPLVVSYSAVTGTATLGSDFQQPASSSLTIAGGTTSGTILVPVVDDLRNEVDETFTVKATAVSPPEGGIADDTGVVTIRDNDQSAPRPNFVVEDVAKVENSAGPATFTVTLTGGAADDVDFSVYMSDGSAVDTGSGVGSNDYNAPVASLTIPVGQTVGTVSVPVNGDTVYEGDESATLHVALADGERDAIGAAKTPVLTITDDDPVPTIALNTASGGEGDDVSVIATVTGVTERDVAYDLGYSGDSTGSNNAAESADYDASGVSPVIPGRTASGAKVNFGSIKLNTDHVDEPVEVLKVAQRTTGDVVGASTIYKINDDVNDLPPSVAVQDASVDEGVGDAGVAVRLVWGAGNDASSTERDTVVSYATANGTATAPSDYTAVTGRSITIAAGEESASIPVRIVDDLRNEVDETFTVKATAVSPPEGGIADDTGVVTIRDNDQSAPRPNFVVEDVAKVENSAGPATFTVTLTGGAADDVDFSVYMSDGSAVDTGSGVGSNDYNAPVASLTIPVGQTVGTVSVPVNGDTVYEGDESATLHVALADGERDAIGAAKTPVLTITDDDPVPTIALNTASGGEGDDVSVIATVTGVTERDVAYDLGYSGDSTGSNNAAESADYDASGVSPVIPGRTASGAKVNFGSIKLNTDHVDEPVEVLKVAQRTTGDVVGASTIYKINDDVNDLPPSVAVQDASVDEGVGDAGVAVRLVWGAGNDASSTERDTVVSYATANGTATAPSDYTAVTGRSITIAAGEESASIPVRIVDDLRNETDETFTVGVTAHTPAEATVTRGTGTVTIADNDAEAPRPTFSVDDISRAENTAGTADFTLRLSGVAEDDVSFTVGMGATDDTAVDLGSGAGSNDYNPPATAVTIPAGQTSVTIPVTVNRDTVYEPDETATLTVALADGERDAEGGPESPTLTILNDDAKPTMTLGTASGYEGDEVGVVALITGTAQDDVNYDLTFFGEDSASINSADVDDFDSSGIDGRIPGGTPSGTRLNLGSIVLADDTIDEPTEIIRAVVHDPTADDTTTDRTSTYRIFDDPTDVPPSVAIGDATVGEGDETASVPVSLSFTGDTTATEQDVTVAYTTVNGTARAGLDYTTATGTIRIPAGDIEGAISVPVTDDTVFEDDQTFTVKLGATTPTGVVVDNGVGTVTIAENDELAAPMLIASTTTLDAPGSVTLTGTAGEGAQVQLFMAPGSSGGSFTAVATATADASGAFSFRRNFDIGYRVQARANGLSSAISTVLMRESPTLTGGSTASGTATLTVTGNPKVAGLVAQIQRPNASGVWTTVATGPLNSAGTYTATVRGLTSGATYNFRAVIVASAAKGTLIGASAAKPVKIR